MEKLSGALRFSSGDLVAHLRCPHASSLDLAVTNGELMRPPVIPDPLLEILRERGTRHEQGYVEHLRAAGYGLTVIEGGGITNGMVAATQAAMEAGAEIIVQGAFACDGWAGRTDILRKTKRPSRWGPWSYEVIDTKLSRETKGNTLLQLCLYGELLAKTQGVMPEWTYVVAPLTAYEPQRFRTADYAAYFRQGKRRLEEAIAGGLVDAAAPEPCAHCEVCRWHRRCDQQWRRDDHLCFVAGIGKGQIEELKEHKIGTLGALAALPLPLAWQPERGSAPAYERLCGQARLQVVARESGQIPYETLPVEPGFGLCRLPEPSPGDLFFDFEGDPFVGEHGLEYLFGYSFLAEDGSRQHVADWALDRPGEKAAFERFMDFVTDRLTRHPGLHIYHYAPYEPSALKRLMGRYGTRETELDSLLRSQRFVDLYAVVRHALRAGVENYSIKRLEPLYGYVRAVGLSDANRALTQLSACLELGDLGAIDASFREEVEGYNRDDCLSTWALRDWLETVRADLIAQGAVIDRPAILLGEPSEALSERQQRIAALFEEIAGSVPAAAEERTPEEQARWLLANFLDWHRREKKSLYWEKFRLAALSAEELLEERAGLAGLRLLGRSGGTDKAPVHRYAFPPQDCDLRGGEDLYALGGEKLGSVVSISFGDDTLEIKKRSATADFHPEAVFAHNDIRTVELENALFRCGEYVAAQGMTGAGSYQAALSLLLREPPRAGSGPLRSPGETPVEAALRLAPLLNGNVLPIQGPPGCGKTYTGSHMICALVQAGRRVGITANSHKVIENLMEEVLQVADKMGFAIECVHKVTALPEKPGRIRHVTDNAQALETIVPGGPVVGGTAWLWAREDAFEQLDVLFVDEAAQMSLANVLAVAQAAQSLVLLGDPRQLEQPIQGSHPEGTEVSALDHLLWDPLTGKPHLTVPEERGLFLGETWRLHPEVCAFTSELFYEDRLRSHTGLEIQVVRSPSRISGSGLRYLPVTHTGNRNASREEAEAIRALVEEILAQGAVWTDRDGEEKPVTLKDILIVAPYNAQVFELQSLLPGAEIGTVDKFQGRQAPIVICSMATSSAADAPRGMEFLYSLNRLNVATSRAKCICILVASPALFEAECQTPRQMQLVNAFCRYLELATAIS